jgi:hypothetical protein
MTRTIRKYFTVALALVISFTLIGCSTAEVVNSLDTVANVAAVAVPIIFATGAVPLDAATQTAIVGYLQSVNTAVIQTGAELQTTDVTQVKASKIVGYFAVAVAPNLPAGTPQAVATAVSAVSGAVTSFLSQFKLNAKAVRGGAPTYTVKVPTTFSPTERSTLSHASQTAANSLLVLSRR